MARTRSDFKLQGKWPNPYVMRPRIALNIKSVDCEFNETPESNIVLLLEFNRVDKKIPPLIQNGEPTCESLIIVEYIDGKWPFGPSILPEDPYDRALARFWAAYLDDKWFPNCKKLQLPGGKAKGEHEKAIREGFVLLEEVLKNSRKNFFGGDNIGYLDIAFGSYLPWLKAAEKLTKTPLLDETTTPTLVKWEKDFSSHSAVKNLIPSEKKIDEYLKHAKATTK